MIFPLLILTWPRYDTFQVEGWTINVDPALEQKSPALWNAVEQELTVQLTNISRVVPDRPLAQIRTIPIWIHITSPQTQCMAFHPDASWLQQHQMDERMAHGVEIGNAANFVSWTYEQPWMVLHELSHGYHYLFLPGGFDNPDVKASYQKAMAAHRYDDVLHWDGNRAKAYATTNPMEYFAECTEAYFGTNDFYPFVRAELMHADSDGYALMQKEWGSPQKRIPSEGAL